MVRPTQYGAFVPLNWIWDIQQLQQMQDISPGLKELLVRLYQNLNLMANVLNISDKGYYDVTEFVNGQLLFPNPNNNSTTAAYAAERQIYRKVINFGALPNTTSKSVAHNITCSKATLFTRIYGAASDQSGLNYIPIPYASASGTTNIELSVTSTNVTITTASDRTNFNMCLIILEYVQS